MRIHIRILRYHSLFSDLDQLMLPNGTLRLLSFTLIQIRIRILLYTLIMDPDTALHLDTDPDPAFHFDADPELFTLIRIRIQLQKMMRIRIELQKKMGGSGSARLAQSTHRAILGTLGGAGDAVLPDLLLARLLELEAEPPVLCAPPPIIIDSVTVQGKMCCCLRSSVADPDPYAFLTSPIGTRIH
jgi:hypothetical protein